MRATVPVKLGGTTLELKLDLSALDFFEKKRGFGLYPALVNHMGVQTVVWLLLSGLKWQNPRLTYDSVLAMLDKALEDGANLSQFNKTLMEALRSYGVLPPEDWDDRTDNPSQPGRVGE